MNVRCAIACWAFLAMGAAARADTAPIADEGLRLAALRAIFPGMRVSFVGGKQAAVPVKNDPDRPSYPDALADEPFYRVIGKAVNQIEEGASENITGGWPSKTRELRFKLFRWPTEGESGLLAVLQYQFAGARPAMASPSIGLLVHLIAAGAEWRIRNRCLLETTHHFFLPGIRMIDLTGDRVDELVVESDFGGGGLHASSLQIVDLTRGRFDELLLVDSRLESYADSEGPEVYYQELDVERTLPKLGREFCFVITQMMEKGKQFRPPRVSRVCYKRGEGVDAKQAADRIGLLAPRR